MNSILENSLKEVQAEKELIVNQLSKLSQKERELKTEIFIRDTGLKIGTKVSIGSRIGKIGGYFVSGEVCPKVRFFKKDGTLGERESKLYSWDLKVLKILS